MIPVLLCAALAVAGCSSVTADPGVLAPLTSASAVATDPSPGGTGRGPGDPASPTVAPNPPATYRSAWPQRTVKNSAGYLVDECVPQRLREQAIAMTDSDGVHLSGLLLGSGPDAVLLSHEQGYSVCSFLDLGEKLAAEGFQVLLPEYRNHGASERVADNDNLDRDAAAALAELRRRGAVRIFAGGASCGGTTSAMIAPTVPHLMGLLIMSSPAQCGPLDAVPAMRKITAPVRLFVEKGDMAGAVEREVRELDAASGSPDKKLVVRRGGDHGTDMFRAAGSGPLLEQRVLEFITACFS